MPKQPKLLRPQQKNLKSSLCIIILILVNCNNVTDKHSKNNYILESEIHLTDSLNYFDNLVNVLLKNDSFNFGFSLPNQNRLVFININSPDPNTIYCFPNNRLFFQKLYKTYYNSGNDYKFNIVLYDFLKIDATDLFRYPDTSFLIEWRKYQKIKDIKTVEKLLFSKD